MMGPNFWAGLAERVGFKVNAAGAPMVRVAAQAEGKVVEVPSRIPVTEAKAAGFFKLASNMGWGLYRVEDIDGGLGSIWSIEKDAETGGQFLVKQTDQTGEVMRLKTAGVMSKASAPASNLWAVAWSKYDGEKKARLASIEHDTQECQDAQCAKCAEIDPHMGEHGIVGDKAQEPSFDAKAQEMFGKNYADLPDDGPEQDAVVHAVQNGSGDDDVIIKEEGPHGR